MSSQSNATSDEQPMTRAETSQAQRRVLREMLAFQTFSRIEIQSGTGIQGAALDKVLKSLENRGLIVQCSNDDYMLCEQGIEEARNG